MIKPVIYWQDPDTENKIIKALQDNKVLITTTDTIPGFLANTTEQSFESLNKIKGGRQNKPYIILISDVSKLDYFVDTQQFNTKLIQQQTQQPNPQIQKLVTKLWPGPLTIIFKAKKELPNFLKSEQGTMAIRCPNYTPLLAVLKHFNGLYSTSANTSFEVAPITIDSVDQQVASQVAYLVDDKEQKSTESHPSLSPYGLIAMDGKPSTILDASHLDASQTDQVRVVREGAYSIQDLEKILGKIKDV